MPEFPISGSNDDKETGLQFHMRSVSLFLKSKSQTNGIPHATRLPRSSVDSSYNADEISSGSTFPKGDGGSEAEIMADGPARVEDMRVYE